MKTYWTKEKVFEESKKYKTRKEFSNNSKYAYLVSSLLKDINFPIFFI